MLEFDMENYYITCHLRRRFIQRSNDKYRHLRFCKIHDCKICKHMNQYIENFVYCNKKSIDIEIIRRIDLAKENRSYINNSAFMIWYYEKYGYDKRFQFLVHE